MRIILATCAWMLAVTIGAVAQDAGRIVVEGQGVVEVVPDMATISLGVITKARTAAAALSENSAATARVLDTVRASGVAERDVQTSGLSLAPQWNNRNSSTGGQPDIVGYVVSNQVTVRVRALPGLGAILDQVVASGATQFHGLNFGLQDPKPALDEARRRAVAEAARKAALYAEAAGVSLGAILQLRETGGGAAPQYAVREMAMSDAVPIAAGEVSISASVSLEYAIGQ